MVGEGLLRAARFPRRVVSGGKGFSRPATRYILLGAQASSSPSEATDIPAPAATTPTEIPAAGTHPSPTTITPVAYLIPVKHSVSYLSVGEG